MCSTQVQPLSPETAAEQKKLQKHWEEAVLLWQLVSLLGHPFQ